MMNVAAVGRNLTLFERKPFLREQRRQTYSSYPARGWICMAFAWGAPVAASYGFQIHHWRRSVTTVPDVLPHCCSKMGCVQYTHWVLEALWIARSKHPVSKFTGSVKAKQVNEAKKWVWASIPLWASITPAEDEHWGRPVLHTACRQGLQKGPIAHFSRGSSMSLIDSGLFSLKTASWHNFLTEKKSKKKLTRIIKQAAK